MLDFILGKEHSVLLRRAELKTLVTLYSNEVGLPISSEMYELDLLYENYKIPP